MFASKPYASQYMKILNSFKKLTKFELRLWLVSVIAVILSSAVGGESNVLSLIASLIGVTALIFVARGDVLGQALTVVFGLLYAVVSWDLKYYGEMITYLGMSAPIALMSVVSWLRHPYKEGDGEVEVAVMNKSNIWVMLFLTVAVTTIFYFILKYFGNARLVVSTISVTTSFLASYLMFCRSPFYALAYAANDIVLIILWVAASFESLSYISMVICFTMFFLNDIYAYFNWHRMLSRQQSGV